eukprot:214591-Rhodomonas_salina.1
MKHPAQPVAIIEHPARPRRVAIVKRALRVKEPGRVLRVALIARYARSVPDRTLDDALGQYQTWPSTIR